MLEDELVRYTDESCEQPIDYLMEKEARAAFIRKVYLIVLAQLLLTAVICFGAAGSTAFLAFAATHTWLTFVVLGIMVAIEISVFCCQGGRTFPLNYCLLTVFTVCQSYLLATLVSYFVHVGKAHVVLTALFLTVALVATLTLIAWTNCVDLTGMQGVMMAAGMGLMATAILGLMFGGGGWISGITVLLFGVFLVYDTQMVLGKGQVSLSYDDYVIGALVIYIDVVTIFSELVRALGQDE